MKEIKNQERAQLDEYMLNVTDQVLKGILLKLKNEIRKPDTPWEVIKPILRSLHENYREKLNEILPLLLE